MGALAPAAKGRRRRVWRPSVLRFLTVVFIFYARIFPILVCTVMISSPFASQDVAQQFVTRVLAAYGRQHLIIKVFGAVPENKITRLVSCPAKAQLGIPAGVDFVGARLRVIGARARAAVETPRRRVPARLSSCSVVLKGAIVVVPTRLCVGLRAFPAVVRARVKARARWKLSKVVKPMTRAINPVGNETVAVDPWTCPFMLMDYFLVLYAR